MGERSVSNPKVRLKWERRGERREERVEDEEVAAPAHP
jgi:hypothetical protein